MIETITSFYGIDVSISLETMFLIRLIKLGFEPIVPLKYEDHVLDRFGVPMSFLL